MASVKFQLETNAGEVSVGINKITDSVSELNTETKTFSKTSEMAFANATTEADEYNKELKTTTDQTKKLAKETNTVASAGNRIKELKNEIKALKSEAILAGEGTEAFAEALKRAGALQDEIDGLNDALKATAKSAGENVTGALGEITNVGISGFEGITAAQSLFGVETQKVEEQLLKLQSIRSLGNVAKEFSDLSGKIQEIKIGLSPLTDAFQNNITSIKDGYGSANESVKDFFKNFGPNVSGGIKSLGTNISGFFTNFGTNAKGLFSSLGSGIKNFASSGIAGIKALGAAVAANPFGIILVAVGALIGILVALRDKIKPIGAIFEFLGDAVDYVSDKLEAFGEALGLVASEAEEKAQKTVDNIDKEISAIDRRYAREIKLAQAAGKDVAEIEESKLATQIVATKKALAAYEVLAKEKGELDKEELEKKAELNEKLIDLQTDLTAEFIKQNTEQAKKAEELRKKQSEEQKKRDDERLKRLQELNAALLDLEKKSEQALLNQLTGEARLKKQREISLREIAELQKSIEEKSKLAGKGGVLEAKQLEQISNLKNSVEKEYQDGITKLAIDGATKRADILNKEAEDALKAQELKTRLQISAVEATQPPKDANEDALVQFEKEKQIAILKIQKQGAIESLEIQENKIDAELALQETALDNELKALEGNQDELSQARIKAIENEKAQLKANAETTKQILFNETEKTVNEVNAKLKELGKVEQPKKFDLADLFGVAEKDKQAFYNSLNEIGKNIQQILSEQIEQQLLLNEKEIESSKEKQEQYEEELKALEGKLSEEEALKSEGFANDSNRTQEQIRLKQAEIEAEKKREQELIEERKRQQKIKLAIDSASQVSNIITAGSALFAEGALKGPVGIATAIATITAMVAAFLSLKNQINAINSGTGFEKGGYTGDVGTKEIAGVVHGKEFVMTADKTDKYFDLFQGIHTGDKNMMRQGISDLLKDTGVSLPIDLSNQIKAGKDSIRSKELNIISQNNNKGIETRLDKLENHLISMVKQGNKTEQILPDGTRVVKNGSHTITIRNNANNK